MTEPEPFDKERFLSGKMLERYFELNKDGNIIPSTFDPPLLSRDSQRAFKIITMRDNLDIYIYNEKKGYYEPHGKQVLREIIKKALREFYEEKHATATINDVTASTGKDRKDLEPPIHLIPLKNGLLNIDHNPPRLGDHSSTMFFTGTLPVEYKPDAECPNFLKFLQQIQPDPVAQMQIHELFGYCLWRQYPYQNTFLLIGAGSNGRSTLLNVLGTLLGEENVSAEALQGICHDKFSKAELYHKFANICGDLPSRKIEDTSAFKKLCGGDLISAQRKHRDPFKFFNYAKLIFLANKVPYSYDDSDAFYRRWILIFFPVRFGLRIGDSPADKHIIETLTTPEELSGILNWALEGLKRLRKQKGFTKTMTMEQTRKYYNRLVSPLSAFIQDCIQITFNPENYITKEEFYTRLLIYCKLKKILAPTKEKVGRLMNKVEPNIKTGHKLIRGEQVYVWTGCQFKMTEEEKEAKERMVIDEVWREASQNA